jgi:hypothetical protein
VGWFFHGLTTGVGDQPTTWQTIDLVASNVLAVKNSDNAWSREGGFFVNRFDVRVRMGGAYKVGMCGVGHLDVIGVLARTSQKAIVFLAT